MREPSPLSPDVALFLDFDGTLADIAPTPDAVRIADGLGAILQDTTWGLNGALAIVSGRPIAVIDDFLDRSVLAVSGVSGAERRGAAGQVHSIPIDPAILDPARAILTPFAAERPGVLLEDKTLGLALHYRLAPDQREACAAVVARCAAESGGRLEEVGSNMVTELRPVGASKAATVRAYMNEAPFAGRRPVFVGDDPVDEDAFTEVNRTNGYSVIVGSRSTTAATHRLPSVAALHAWLRDFAAKQVRGEPMTAPRPALRARQHGRLS